MCGELEVKTKESEALGDKLKNLKESVTAKTKQIKELEKEVCFNMFVCSCLSIKLLPDTPGRYCINHAR